MRSLHAFGFNSFFVGLVALGCGGELVAPLGSGGAGGGAGGGESGGGGSGGGTAPGLYPNLACDPLVPSYCGFPFPSNVYSVDDPTTETGRRVAFLPEGMPLANTDYVPSPDYWSKADGFSPGSAIVAHFPGATAEGLPTLETLGDSLLPSSPTLLLDVDNASFVLHWSELDKSTDLGDQRSLLIHPAEPLRDGARYVVVVQGLVDAGGDALEPTAAYKALRDGEPSDEESVEARRELYEDLFTALDGVGVGKEATQLVWDFTTASRASNTSWMVHMRDEAEALVGTDGPAYTIDEVDPLFDPINIAFKLKGTMEVPLYLDQAEPGASLLFGDDGMPEPNGTYQVEWELLIPQSALGAPSKLLQHGHGLLGSYEQIESEHFRTFCNTNNYSIFATKLVGMAEEDEAFIVGAINDGKIDDLAHMFDRMHQGTLNSLLLMTMMSRGMTQDPLYGQYLDGDERYYWGISQGGISGGVYMALSKDVERGVLEVMGQPYNLLLNRSVDFEPFFALLNLRYPDPRAQQHFLGLVQMGWDRVEPNGYTKYIFDDPFPGSPPNRRVLMRAAVGDHQVTTYGAHVMARAMNATHLDTGIRDIFGLTKASGPLDMNGAYYAEWDFGLPPEPSCNVPLESCEDPHGKLRKLDDARSQLNEFLANGVVENDCPAGVCDYTAMSGCTGGEDQDLCD
jgi:hypothetical protein